MAAGCRCTAPGLDVAANRDVELEWFKREFAQLPTLSDSMSHVRDLHDSPRRGLAATAFVIVAVLLALAWIRKPEPSPNPPAPLLTLESLGNLVTVKVYVSDVVEFTKSRSLEVPWTDWELRYGGTKVLLIAKGDCLVATDMRAAKSVNVDEVNRTVSLQLPIPRVLQARLNHAPKEQGGSHLYAVTDQGIEAIIPDGDSRIKAIDAAMMLAQKKIEEAGRQPEVIGTAKANTEHLIRTSYEALGWKAKIEWNEGAAPSSSR